MQYAGIAQLVERNLAKVEVASSSLVSRSSSKKGSRSFLFFRRFCELQNLGNESGAIAKRLCNGLQIRLVRFDSGSRLQNFFQTFVCEPLEGSFFCRARFTHGGFSRFRTPPARRTSCAIGEIH